MSHFGYNREFFTKELQGYKFYCFHNIIIGIHEDDSPSYNEYGRAFMEEKKRNKNREEIKKIIRRPPNLQEIESTKECFGKKLDNKLRMYAWCTQEGTRWTNILCRMHVLCTYIVWCKLTQFCGRWSHWWHIHKNSRPFRDMIIQISEYSLMGKYSIVGCCKIILYNIIHIMICRDEKCILYVTFITLICLKY